MKRKRYFGLVILNLALLAGESRAGTGLETEGFAAIFAKNAFRLSAPKPEGKPVVIQPELPQISLQGLTTLLNIRQALLRIQKRAKPGATEVACILGEGQVQDGVKVLRIDMESGTVWLTNQGAEQVLNIQQ